MKKTVKGAALAHKKKFRKVIHEFLSKCDNLGLPLGQERFESTVVVNTTSGETNLADWTRGYYTTGTHTFFAWSNNPSVQAFKELDEVCCLVLVCEREDGYDVLCRVELRCSNDTVRMRTSFENSIHPGGEQTSVSFSGEHDLKAALYRVLAFVAFVSVAFRHLIQQPSEPKSGTGGSGSTSHGANDGVLSLLRAFTGALDEHRD